MIDFPIKKKPKAPSGAPSGGGQSNVAKPDQERKKSIAAKPSQEKREVEFTQKWLNDKYIATLECTKEHTIAYMEDPKKKRTLEKCEGTIKANLHGFVAVCIALYDIRKWNLWKDTPENYQSFEDYIHKRWNWGRARGYQLAKTGEICRILTLDYKLKDSEFPQQVSTFAPLLSLESPVAAKVYLNALEEHDKGRKQEKSKGGKATEKDSHARLNINRKFIEESNSYNKLWKSVKPPVISRTRIMTMIRKLGDNIDQHLSNSENFSHIPEIEEALNKLIGRAKGIPANQSR